MFYVISTRKNIKKFLNCEKKKTIYKKYFNVKNNFL